MPHEAVLELYQVHAVTEGTDAQAEVSVRLSADGRSVTARGADPDTLVASAQAYLAALNKLMAAASALTPSTPPNRPETNRPRTKSRRTKRLANSSLGLSSSPRSRSRRDVPGVCPSFADLA